MLPDGKDDPKDNLPDKAHDECGFFGRLSWRGVYQNKSKKLIIMRVLGFFT